LTVGQQGGIGLVSGSDAAKFGNGRQQRFIVCFSGSTAQANARRDDVRKGFCQPLRQIFEVEPLKWRRRPDQRCGRRIKHWRWP
jgi:hypothetical protein